MPTLGAGLANWNKIDDSRWEHGRVKVADLPRDSPSHEGGVVIHYTSCPPPKGTTSKGTVLLVHGFPQTSYQFRRVITPIANAGHTVIAPDYRGAGASSKPWNGYTKEVMAQDLHTLVHKIGVKEKIHLVGHDIGGMIAHAYTQQFPCSVASLCWGECPLPGTPFYHTMKNSLLLWHFTFHRVPDLPETLIAGREKLYLKHFYDRQAQNPDAISAHDLDVYGNAFAAPGALRAGLNVYRAFEQDGEDNVARVQSSGKSKVRCLSLWGDSSFADEEAAKEMSGQFYEDVQFEQIEGCGHWIAEEKPGEFVENLVRWFERI
ncbi:Soluble epoxide hydrolase [Fulvia fulva]|nr:Soluble epoxide hydrolase [Fulvia fulva]WPV14345.1 Soluble epoxide hydrolase [Fulvia fulva]WPV28368.1 Soluble epoxide hydrolase [Fulvia fulva]